MPKFLPKSGADGAEPLNADVYVWSDWALERVKEALDAGAEPPRFRQESPWHWIYLSSRVSRDPDLWRRAQIDSATRRVTWEQPDSDEP
jgi:hypothetical protein